MWQDGRNAAAFLEASPSEATRSKAMGTIVSSLCTHTPQRAQQRKDRKSLLYEVFQCRFIVSTTPKGSERKDPDHAVPSG